MRKAQSSMEFVILTSFMLMSFLVFFIVIQGKLVEANRDKLDMNAKQIETLVVNELKLAESVTDGYYREFDLPREIMGKDYTIEILSGVDNTPEIVIKYSNKERVYFVPKGHLDSTSTINRGRNKITKIDGKINVQYCDGDCSITPYQSINLYLGWNFFSLNVKPSNISFDSVFSGMNPTDVNIAITDINNNILANYTSGTWDVISNLDSKQGYKVKVSKDMVLRVNGTPININTNIDLLTGLNFVPYYPTIEINASLMGQYLRDKGCLISIRDVSGKSYSDWGPLFGGWKNTIGMLKLGQGYIIKTNSTCTLNYAEI